MEDRKEEDMDYEDDPAMELFYEAIVRHDEKKLKEAYLCKKDRKIKQS